jgi:lipoprotein-anchoring transpeptidase ErfK/SrfK
MLKKLNHHLMPLAAAAALLTTGCVFESDSKRDETQAQAKPQATPAPAPKPQPPDLSLEVNIAQRQVHVHKGGQVIASHPVAVGSDEWPTPTGEWTIGQVIFNPRWTPPKDESWAKDEKVAEPGAPDNPLGVVQLVYNPPNSIHGTNEPSSLGKAVSHGSIRVANEVGVELAKMVMQAGGAGKDDAWVQNALANKTERQEVAIPNPVTIRVVSGK